MHDDMPYDRNQGQGQGHSREVDRQSPTGLIFIIIMYARYNMLLELYVNAYSYIVHHPHRHLVRPV